MPNPLEKLAELVEREDKIRSELYSVQAETRHVVRNNLLELVDGGFVEVKVNRNVVRRATRGVTAKQPF